VARIVVADAAVAPWHDLRAVRGGLADVVDAAGLSPRRGAPAPSPADALTSAHAVIAAGDAGLGDGRTRQYSVAVADVDLGSGNVAAAVAGDCEVWVRVRGAWRLACGGEMLTAEARARWEALVADVDDEAVEWAMQAAHLRDGDWEAPPVGQAPPRRAPVTVVGVDALIVTSDGARLTAERCAALDGWLTGGIHSERPPTPRLPHPHGDLYAVAAWREGKG
jgi:hypothetical protein